MPNDMLLIGKVSKTHGLAGELKIWPLCDSAVYLSQFQELIIKDKIYKVTSSRVHKKLLLAKLEGVTSIEDAMMLLNNDIFVTDEAARAVLPEGKHYVRDLTGCEVFTEAGEFAGTLSGVLNLPAQDVYVIKTERGDAMIPVVEEFVKNVDITAKKIIITPIEGMLP